MKCLPNGVTVFNATPHAITFWREDWDDVVVVESDDIINAVPQEEVRGCTQPRTAPDWEGLAFVETVFTGNDEGREIIRRAKEAGADVVVGSIIAAQAYPGEVAAMIPAPGYERVPPPVPAPLMAVLNAAIGHLAYMGEVVTTYHEAYLKYAEAPTKRMRPDKFTIFSNPEAAGVPDGLYAVKGGKQVKIDAFTWGYEGLAYTNHSRIEHDERVGNVLIAGPGDIGTDSPVLDFREGV